MRQQFRHHHRVQPQRLGEGQGRRHVPAQHGTGDCPQLATKAADQIPDLPAVMAQGLAQPRGAVLALRFTGLAVTVAPTEVPVGEGAEPFFSASSSIPGLT